ARSGDKGGDANVGVWTESAPAWHWLRDTLTVDRFQALLPETRGLAVHRHELPNLRALNFTVTGILGDGVASGHRFDPQAKALGEWLRARHLDIPVDLLPPARRPVSAPQPARGPAPVPAPEGTGP
ncbi:AtuA-related protein, partial [Streptomyces virginiae]